MNRLSNQLRDLMNGRRETEIRRISTDEQGVNNMMVSESMETHCV